MVLYWHCDCDLAKQQLPFPGQFAMGWYGMDASDSDDNVFSTRTSAAPPHPPVDPSLSMSPLSAAGWRDVPSADIPSPLAQLRSQISSLFLSRHCKKIISHYKGRNLNWTVVGKFVTIFGMLNKFFKIQKKNILSRQHMILNFVNKISIKI